MMVSFSYIASCSLWKVSGRVLNELCFVVICKMLYRKKTEFVNIGQN